MEYQITSFKDDQTGGSEPLTEGKARLGQLFPQVLVRVVVLLFFLVSAAQAQTGRLSGTIVASTTDSPLAEVHVFIPNTTFQAFSDGDGNFLLANVPEGTWELQVRGQGWEQFSQEIQIKAGLPVRLAIRLKEGATPALSPSTLSNSKRSKLTEAVQEAFVGRAVKAVKPQLLNPDKLIFEEQKDKSYRAHSSGPLFFSNEETGYLVAVYFDPFTLETSSPQRLTYAYFELPKEESKEEARRAARLKAYQTSPAFYIAQLMEGKTALFSTPANPEVAFTAQPGTYSLAFAKPLSVSLTDGSKGTLDYSGEKLLVHLSGNAVSPSQLNLGGFFLNQNPIFGVPANFNADRLTKLANLEKSDEVMQERIYLHTDRKHYWPAENIYFKAYLSYGNPLMAEELSKVLHLELIDTTGYVWMHQVVEIKGGVAQGHLSLPDLAETGNFYLRAYTAWSLNYEQEELVLPIQILAHQTQPAASLPALGAKRVGIFSDKQAYGPGEKVTLNILAVDEEGKPLKSNFSVSVLDGNQAVYVPESRGMEALFFPSKRKSQGANFPIEKGFELAGNLLDDNGAPVQGSIKAFVNGYEDVRTLKSGKDGSFSFPASNFPGEFEVSLQATDQNARPIRVIQLKVKSYPSQGSFEALPFPGLVPRGMQPEASNLPIQPLKQGEIMLEEAVVEEKRENSVGPMIYGKPDKVVTTEGMNLVGTTLQFIYALSAQVAGLRIVGAPPNVRVSFRAGEPLVLINGVPANGSSGTTLGGGGGGRTFYEVLEGINIFNIERVEVIRRLVPMYGDLGRNGVISIILKSGEQLQKEGNNFTLLKLQGFAPRIPFEVVEASRKFYPFLKPFRPTLYWNPSLTNDGSRLAIPIEFLLNEKAGPILVEVRGITELGEPIYGTFVLNEPTKEAEQN
jgi:hypothetical protein